MNTKKLCELCDLVSVATACGPAVKWVKERLPGWPFHMEEDGFFFLLPPGGKEENIKILYVAHVDEIGGIILQPHISDGSFKTRVIGNLPEIFAERALVAMDYLDEDGSTIRPCRGKVAGSELLIEGDNIKPFKTVFTFDEKAEVKGDWIYGKAIDPRVTAFALIESVYRLNSPEVGLMLIFAEECSMLAGEKGAHFAAKRFPNLSLIVNCDVPGLENTNGASIKKCIMRLYEGRDLIDPHFGIRIHEELIKRGCEVALGSTRTGSQTDLFIPQAHAISLAVAAEETHVARTRAYLPALEDLINVLSIIPELYLRA